VRHWEGDFTWGSHLEEWAERMGSHDRTVTLGPRYHLKSHTAYAYCMWELFDFEGAYREILYFSYTQDLAADHTERLKKYLQVNPYFSLHDVSPAKTEISCYNEQGQQLIVKPQGMFSFKRGRHPHVVIIDDPLKDPQTPLSLEQIEKVTTVFREEIMAMPKKGGKLHLLGTSQDSTDLFWVTKQMEGYDWGMYPAIWYDEQGKRHALWPENYDLDWLDRERKNMGAKAFSKEMLLDPVRRAEGYFTRAQVDDIINHSLKDRTHQQTENMVYAGLDIGKKRHPSHLAVFMDYNGKLIQLHSHWFDDVDYTEQVEYCRQMISNLRIDSLYYDSTRAEFESFVEQNTLPDEMEGVVFTTKSKWQMAEGFDREVTNNTIELLPEERQRQQILMVDNNLKSPETPQGHGDSFWSIALAIDAARGGARVEMIEIA